MVASETRLPVAKTYKIYIDGKFPRTESGRYFALEDKKGQVLANVCRSSRKDFRNAVVAGISSSLNSRSRVRRRRRRETRSTAQSTA